MRQIQNNPTPPSTMSALTVPGKGQMQVAITNSAPVTMGILVASFNLKLPLTSMFGALPTGQSVLVVTKPFDQNSIGFSNTVGSNRSYSTITVTSGNMTATIKSALLVNDLIETQADGSVVEQLTFSFSQGNLAAK